MPDERVGQELPDGAVEVCRIAVTGYFGDDGELMYVVARRGDAPLSTALGLLEMAKLDLYREAQE